DMYGGFIVPPDDDDAYLGFLFWHKDGFSTACGHGTIALGAWAIHTGLVPPDPSGMTEVRIEVPSGRVTARGRTDGNQVVGGDFVNVPSYGVHRGAPGSASRAMRSSGSTSSIWPAMCCTARSPSRHRVVRSSSTSSMAEPSTPTSTPRASDFASRRRTTPT